MTPPIDTTIARLELACNVAAALDAVASAEVWTPSEEEIAEYATDGIVAVPTLEVTVWGSERDPHDVVCRIEGLGLERIGTGSSLKGPCYVFVAR